MQRLEVSGAVRPIYGSLGVKRLRMPVKSTSTPTYVFIAWSLSGQAKTAKLKALYLMSTRAQSILYNRIIC